MHMARISLLIVVLVIGAVAAFHLDALGTAPGTKQQGASAAKEEPLSVTAKAAPIDMRQPRHIKTATFALG